VGWTGQDLASASLSGSLPAGRGRDGRLLFSGTPTPSLDPLSTIGKSVGDPAYPSRRQRVGARQRVGEAVGPARWHQSRTLAGRLPARVQAAQARSSPVARSLASIRSSGVGRAGSASLRTSRPSLSNQLARRSAGQLGLATSSSPTTCPLSPHLRPPGRRDVPLPHSWKIGPAGGRVSASDPPLDRALLSAIPSPIRCAKPSATHRGCAG